MHCTIKWRDPLRDKIREVGRGLSLADTQTGLYVLLYSRRRLCARRGTDGGSGLLLNVKGTFIGMSESCRGIINGAETATSVPCDPGADAQALLRILP